MLEAEAAHVGAMAVLVLISFLSYLTGLIFRKWPEEICRYAAQFDGIAALLPPETHRAVVRSCGFAFLILSGAALLAATFLV